MEVALPLPIADVTDSSLITVKHMLSLRATDIPAEKEQELAEKVTVTIVVNGQPTEVSAPAQASVESLIPAALAQTGNVGQPPDNWELRDAAGKQLGPKNKVGEFMGQTLFLNLKAGIGGTSNGCAIH
jgi:hypothetical protein